MESEQSQSFNDRISQWVADQGFWFQLRYSMAGSGMKGRLTFHLMKMAFRLMIFIILVALGTWVYLIKRTESPRFFKSLNAEVKKGLSAKELEFGFQHSQGNFEIGRIAAEGGPETFFTSFEARAIRGKMGLLDGIVGRWDPGVISIAKLDLELRAGADDADSARKFSESLLRKPTKVDLKTFEIGDANIRWGYSERTQGSITSSALNAQRTTDGWKLVFKGGWFSQNWLQKLEIVTIVAVCNGDELVFEKAELKQGAATVDFSGLRVTGSERPRVDGVAKIRNLDISQALPIALETFVEGTISGDFRVFGSTNNSEGIGFDGQVVLDGKDSISLRERIHILKALSVVDFSRNYHRVDFHEGTFLMKSYSGGLEIRELKLKAEDIFTLEGAMNVRLPTDAEVQEAIAKGTATDNSILFSGERESASVQTKKVESEFSLKKAGQAARIREGMQSAESLSLFDRLGLGNELRILQAQEAERRSRMLQYEGDFRVTIPGDAFERAKWLKEQYPVDPSTGRIPIKVPIEGGLYEITLKQAEEVYQQAKQ
ncbi:MAG: hypothetical protein H8M99_09685 [Gloeobacteraceae cyanobacterium ES-bin-144]|nr:hypothetical protein [Verrucomicrobiales bacterium]